MKLKIITANYDDDTHAGQIIELLDHYAQDPMGGSKPLDSYVKTNLVQHLAQVPGAFSILCYFGDQPVGLTNCFQGFSTFKCKPIVNIHDVVTHAEHRGKGVAKEMLLRVEEIAKQRGCCKITLEVLEGNKSAQKAYEKFGFKGYELDPEMGNALFWEKPL